VARPLALAATLVASLLAVSGAGGASAQTPKRGGTIVLAWPSFLEPPCLNVFVERCLGARGFAAEVLEGAFEFGPDDTYRPNLAEATFTTKPPFTIVYHIRPDARWSDGVPITARDFVFTRQALRKVDPDNFHVTDVRSIRVLDAKTVEVVLRARLGRWRQLFSVVLPQHALVGEDFSSTWTDRIDNPKSGESIASGPFLVDFERGKQLSLVRNRRYWGSHLAHLDRVRFEFRTGTGTADESLRAGASNMAMGSVVPGQVTEFRSIPGIRVVLARGPGFDHLLVRVGAGGHPALRNKLVRRALAYGIDRVGVVRALWGDALPALGPLDSLVLLSQSRYYRPNWSAYRYRPAQARRLLQQAGCSEGADGIYVCAGQRLSLRLASTPQTRRLRATPLIQADLRRAGIEVKPQLASPAVVEQQIIPSGEYDLAFVEGAYAVPDTVLPSLVFRCMGQLNFTGYCQRLVTRDLEQSTRILDAERRARALNRADAQMAGDVPVIPLYAVPIYVAARSKMRGVIPSFPPQMAWNAENWWLAE
jgi:peptide/nickel transport system substrate-binding protein